MPTVRRNENFRESWLVNNRTSNILSIGDLPSVPAIPAGKSVDLLTFYTKDKISQSANYKELVDAGWLRLKKRVDDVEESIDDASAASAVLPADEDWKLSDDTSPTLGGSLNADGHHIGFAQQTITYNSGTTTISWNLGNKASLTFGVGNITTLAFTNPPRASNLVLKIIQDSVGSRTITSWDSDIKWPSGTAPTLSPGTDAEDIVSFYFDGTFYYGVSSLNFS